MAKGIQLFLMGLVGIGMVTALTLPDRKTAQVIDAGRKLVTGGLHTSITGKA